MRATARFTVTWKRKTAAVLLGSALAGVCASACSPVERDDISAEFVRRTKDACDDGSGGAGGGNALAPRPMDTYVVRLLEFDDISVVLPDPADCVRCAAGENCHVEQPTCLCGAPVQPSPTELGAMLSGVRFGALDYERVYCLQVLALDRSTLAGGAAPPPPADGAAGPAACDCDSAWTMPAELPTDARLCALSVPYAVGPLSLRLDVECRSDGAAFSQCLGLPN